MFEPFGHAALANIKMFGHQTMFDNVWSSNISRLARALLVNFNHSCQTLRHFDTGSEGIKKVKKGGYKESEKRKNTQYDHRHHNEVTNKCNV